MSLSQRTRLLMESLEPRTLMTAGPSVPTGAVETFTAATISGWAFNADDGATAMHVIITIDGTQHILTASTDRPDLTSKKLGSTDHGFSYAVGQLATGKHTVTVDIADPETNTVLKRLKSGNITIAAPTAVVESATATTISGYAFWAESPTTAVQIVITLDGTTINLPADDARPDLVKKIGANTDHGFSYSVPALHTGNNPYTISMIDPSTGASKVLKTGNIAIGAASGAVATFTTTAISGWAYNPVDSNAPVNVVINVNGNTVTLSADDYQAALIKTTGTGYHGFTFNLPTDPTDPNADLMLQPGNNTVSVTLVDPYTGATKLLKSGTIVDKPPTAVVDIHTNTEIAGSVSDPDGAGSLMFRIDVNGVPLAIPALANNPRKKDKLGNNIGFDVTGDFAGKVVEVYAYDVSSQTPFLVWTNNHAPKGATPTITGFNVSGWAVDPDDVSTPINVEVDIDGVAMTTATANLDSVAYFKQAGSLSAGFSVDIPGLTPGKHTIAVYALDGQAGGAAPVLIGSKVITDTPPIGTVETVNSTQIKGWALDPDLGANATQVSIYVDQQFFATINANQARPDLVAKYKSPNHGFTLNFADFFSSGDLAAFQAESHSITVTVLDDRDSDNRQVVIYDGFINNHTPTGAVESVTATTITGWALDPDTTDAIPVDMYIDGTYSATVSANVTRSDRGDSHGFSFNMPELSFGTHTVTFYAAESQHNVASLIGTTTITNNHAVGVVESFDGTNIVGWADDPDVATQSVAIQIFVNGVQVATGTADQNHANLPDTMGATHGFSIALPTLSSGTNQIDVYVVDPNNGLLSYLGSKIVTISSE